jgi:2-amino-4-hydroxy-6-hydroxymethyldihydropteridine diphosphokinase
MESLSSVGTLRSVSSFYETEPVEFTSQPCFLNCAVELQTEETPERVLSTILQIEQALGRQRSSAQPKGPRIIDIDILLFGDYIIDTAHLTIPHPSLAARRFVLQPLAEIAPELRHPILKRTIRELLDALPPGQAVCKVAFN